MTPDSLLAFMSFGFTEILVIGIVALLVFGGTGRDLLIGGTGRDTMFGGSLFGTSYRHRAFERIQHNGSRIAFENAAGKRINLVDL